VLDKYEGNFPQLSVVNSLVVDNLIFYIGKVGSIYVAWEYKTKIKIVATDNKPRIQQWLKDNIVEIKRRLDELDT